ncbi:MAG: hypothetical protein CMJ78_15080 [Planctomycetaceae bacterium]|nr:hypothetical protein [Planctomycetaceae bacterium]
MSDSLSANSLSQPQRIVILVVGFLGWAFAGVQMSITSIAMRPATQDLMARVDTLDRGAFLELSKRSTAEKKAEKAGEEPTDPLTDAERDQYESWRGNISEWYSWYVCAFLFGAAAGGLLFGRIGDQIGRKNAMAASIMCYSVFSLLGYFVQSPTQLLIIRFLTCLGIGGMWPNGVALVSEAWANLSRPMIAGVIGTAANVGIFGMSTWAKYKDVTPDDWRWTMIAGGAPILLGLFSFFAVAESPMWLAAKGKGPTDDDDEYYNPDGDDDAGPKREYTTGDVFRSFLGVTVVGILLATVPLLGGWGSANWMSPWADEAGEIANPPQPDLKAKVGQARSLTGTIGSFLGGWIASIVGRKRTYFLISLGALFSAQYAFWFTVPTDSSFLFWVSALGLFSGTFFGWLPLFLPELFPTSIRSTGAGVSFNFGRILTAVTVFATGALKTLFDGDYALIGRVTSLIYLVGMAVILLAPDTTDKNLEDD